MGVDEDKLKAEIIEAYKSQGFIINPEPKPKNTEKETLKQIHKQKKREKLAEHSYTLTNHFDTVRDYAISGDEIEPEKIELELVEVKTKTDHARIFRWWSLMWWSLPYTQPIGRQMRYLLWDRYHDAPFGLFGLQSPTLRSKVRDDYLNLDADEVDYWINQAMYGHRIGAIPPYNELLGAKMTAMAMTSNMVRNRYAEKYDNTKTVMEERVLPNRLLFITTTAAYGKSSVYERLRYRGDEICEFIGYTSGSGTFHLPEDLYQKCLEYLEQEGMDTSRGYGTGPSRKLKLITDALRRLGLRRYKFHNVKRGYYIFHLVDNLEEIIHNGNSPNWEDRPFDDLVDFWLERWCIPRSERIDRWQEFNADEYFEEAQETIESL